VADGVFAHSRRLPDGDGAVTAAVTTAIRSARIAEVVG
jgi:hypothetical protein